MRFPETIANMRANGRLNASLVIFFDFVGGPTYAWIGIGDLRTVEGITWKGIGDVVAMSGGAQTAGMLAPNMSFTVAATPEMVDLAIISEETAKGRRAAVGIQFFDEAWQPTDFSRVIYNGVIDTLSYEFNDAKELITVDVESAFVRRRADRRINLTSAEHKADYPDDTLLDFVAELSDKTVNWPVP